MNIARFLLEAAAAGFKKRPALSDIEQSSAEYGQRPVWNGTQWQPEQQLEDMTTVRLDKDTNGVFTRVQHKRDDGTIYRESVLTEGVSPNYTKRTVTYFAADGNTAAKVNTYTLSYTDNELTSEVKVN